MSRWIQNADERHHFEAIILWAVGAGFAYTDQLRDAVHAALVQRRQPWATQLARTHDFNTKLRTVINRLRNEGRIACDKQGTRSRWRLCDATTHAYKD